jgi:hypothetical protein
VTAFDPPTAGAVQVIRPDVRVHDPLALAEIELYGELVIAATGSDGPLTQSQIDAVLGIDLTRYPTVDAPAARHSA